MKNTVVIFSLPLLLSIGLFVHSSEVNAEVGTNEQSHSGINISITERTLSLDDVSIPMFNPTTLTGKKVTLTPTNDFIVTVSDKRNETRQPWTLYYNVSAFSTNNEETIPDQQFSIGKGTIDGLSKDSYNALYVNASSDIVEPMVQVDDATKTMYKYHVSKNDLSLSLGEKTKPGDYVAKQTLLLASLPDSQ